jgi:hypothetical protein
MEEKYKPVDMWNWREEQISRRAELGLDKHVEIYTEIYEWMQNDK